MKLDLKTLLKLALPLVIEAITKKPEKPRKDTEPKR